MRDLVELADIGKPDPNISASPFGISPDGKQIAFLIRRANPDMNSYCQRLVVTDMAGQETAREVDRGGDYLRDSYALRDFTSISAGWGKVITPRWSPDGRRIAYLKRTNDSDQVWIADAAGADTPVKATAMPDNVEDFAWLPSGAGLVVATRPQIREKAQAIAREARRGFLFDERFSPQFGGRPIPTGPAATAYSVATLGDHAVRTATKDEIDLLAPSRPEGVPDSARMPLAGPGGRSAWLEPVAPERLIGPSRLVISRPGSKPLICGPGLCSGIQRLWWSPQGTMLYAVQSTGWGQSQMAILRWDMRQAAPRRILLTDDALIGCEMAAKELVCAREGATRPRRIVGRDLASGTERIIFDPNPDFASIRLGTVQRLRFRNSFGVESYADLVLPPDHKPGQKHPLVVVQYISRGFLRGGTGDEVPIQVLAANGFAVLSFARPDFPPEDMVAGTDEELLRALHEDWSDRRSVQSSLDMALTLAIGTGTVDAARMGISGFSDGTSTVQWALINSDRFKVASLGACCEDIYAYPLAAGPRFSRFTRAMGYRFFDPETKDYWQPMSLILNVDKIHTPILIQTGDSEYEIGLDVMEVYERHKRPIELYVLDDEPHIKWQPAHRLAMYQRSVEWFAFWLLHRMNCNEGQAAQYERWKAMEGAPPHNDLACAKDSSPVP
ncbi:MAG: Atxe2 family lasso peptide isopeptidase [Rhodobacteraceae bacterium]|nr:Atxe2 family lasso peptide isopeptidase [Paracoccaceae bacterium]